MEPQDKQAQLSFETLQNGHWETNEQTRLEMPKLNGQVHETVLDKCSDAYHKLLDLLHLS